MKNDFARWSLYVVHLYNLLFYLYKCIMTSHLFTCEKMLRHISEWIINYEVFDRIKKILMWSVLGRIAVFTLDCTGAANKVIIYRVYLFGFKFFLRQSASYTLDSHNFVSISPFKWLNDIHCCVNCLDTLLLGTDDTVSGTDCALGEIRHSFLVLKFTAESPTIMQIIN